MRAFLALNIDENIKNKYHNLLLKKIDDNIAEVKFVNKNKMHITLVFFENIKESDIEKIKSSLEKTSNIIKPFNILFEKLSYFTNKFNDINVLFVKANCKELDEYVKHLRDNINIKYDKKDFKSHLTLARVKKVYDNDKLKDIINNIHFEKSSFLANSITLYESDFVNYKEIFTLTF
ncbi:2-5 RNA ligase LigT [Brachyspira pilosicoli WesB]|uniref:RNA 2',3'-cyclic phosphodiesterase n=1 Tax=Brachyspira pilosicoli WesB TaxID=1161918 RepID=K0JGY8_BRAPL|nr:RNA 2',3'-cyclic phosphodiesterase [Brachyspira pilosicoli]CCG56139.1 2-5 RNA ligase LigT [Brachyspira pilosicoli WesB]